MAGVTPLPSLTGCTRNPVLRRVLDAAGRRQLKTSGFGAGFTGRSGPDAAACAPVRAAAPGAGARPRRAASGRHVRTVRRRRRACGLRQRDDPQRDWHRKRGRVSCQPLSAGPARLAPQQSLDTSSQVSVWDPTGRPRAAAASANAPCKVAGLSRYPDRSTDWLTDWYPHPAAYSGQCRLPAARCCMAAHDRGGRPADAPAA